MTTTVDLDQVAAEIRATAKHLYATAFDWSHGLPDFEPLAERVEAAAAVQRELVAVVRDALPVLGALATAEARGNQHAIRRHRQIAQARYARARAALALATTET